MSHLQYFSYPGFGDRSKVDAHYSQAVRIGDIIKISGQGGWHPQTEKFPTDLLAEIEQAYSNVQLTLEHAGSKGWSQVYATRVYVTKWDEETLGGVVQTLKKWCPDHQPLMTAVQVAGLHEGMRIEVEAEAHLGE